MCVCVCVCVSTELVSSSFYVKTGGCSPLTHLAFICIALLGSLFV